MRQRPFFWMSRMPLQLPLAALVLSLCALAAAQDQPAPAPAPAPAAGTEAPDEKPPAAPGDAPAGDPKFSGGTKTQGEGLPIVDPEVIDIDLDALFYWPESFESHVTDDPIWIVRGSGGAFGRAGGDLLLQLPCVIKPDPNRILKLDANTLKVKGGKFVAWKVESPDFQPPDPQVQRTSRKRGVDQKIEVAPGHPLHPDSKPRMAKELQILPDGKVRWKLDKLKDPAALKTEAGQYSYKVDIKALQAKKPAPLGDPPKGKEAQVAFRAKQQEFRGQLNEFLALQKRVTALPTEFEEPMPPRLWAIFSVKATSEDISIESVAKPFPWGMGLDALRTMRVLILSEIEEREFPRTPDGKPDTSVLPVKRMEGIKLILDLLDRTHHRYTAGGVARMVSGARLAGYAQIDDPLYRLIISAVKYGSSFDRALITKEVATTIPPTKASLKLIQQLTSMPDLPDIKSAMADLKKEQDKERLKLPAAAASATEIGGFITGNLAALKDKDAGAVVTILANLFHYADLKPEMVGKIIADAPINEMPPERLREAVIYTLNYSYRKPVAARLLNERLLGSTQPAVVKLTLESLIAAEITEKIEPPASADVQPQPGVRRRGVPPPEDAGGLVAGNAGAPAGPAGPPDDSKMDLSKAVLPVRPVIYAPNHNALTLLTSSEPEIVKLAWEALRAFNMGPGNDGNRPDRFDVLTNAYLVLQRTGPEFTDFLLRQHRPEHQTRILQCLITLVQQGQSAVKIRGARALLGRPGPMEELLKDMSFEERFAFVRRLYESHDAAVPMVLGLIKQKVRDAPLLAWFAKELTAGRLPDPSTWASGYERDPELRDEKLLEVVGAWDEDMSRGAVAALVAAAKGAGQSDDRLAQDLLRNWKKEGLTQDLDKLWPKWQTARQAIFRERLAKVVGAYRVRLRGPGVNELLATVELKIEGEKLSINKEGIEVSVPFRFYGLRIRKPGEVKNFGNAIANKLPWEELRDDLQLLAQDNGSFLATVDFDRRGRFELVFEPENPS